MTTALTTLRNVPLFAQLRDSDLEVLLKVVRTRDYPRHSLILHPHEPCEAFYVLLSGQVKITLVAEDGREMILTMVRPGDFFGERALLNEEPHAASASAMENTRLLVLSRPDFQRCVKEMPGIAFGLLRALVNRLRDADEKISGLVFLDVPGRICHLLLQLAGYGDGESIQKPPTHQVLAQMVGTSRETVSRTLAAFADQGLIEIGQKRITLKNREALLKGAGMQRAARRNALAAAAGDRERRSGPAVPPVPGAAGLRT